MSLEELRNEFLAIQEEKDAVRLSDRNVIELVSYLVSKNMLPNLMFTVDGREYITQRELEREIYRELDYSGGRVKIMDIPAILNVDISNIEESIKKILQVDPSVQKVGTELITKYLILFLF